jgi:hypothetical protein
MAEAKSDQNRYDSNPSRHRGEPLNWHYALAGLLTLFPGFGLGYLVLHRGTPFQNSIATWLVLSVIGFFMVWTEVGLSTLSVSITVLLSWSLVAEITASHLLIAAMTQDWVVMGAWSRLGAIMGVLAVPIGSLIYLLGLAIVVVILNYRCLGECCLQEILSLCREGNRERGRAAKQRGPSWWMALFASRRKIGSATLPCAFSSLSSRVPQLRHSL